MHTYYKYYYDYIPIIHIFSITKMRKNSVYSIHLSLFGSSIMEHHHDSKTAKVDLMKEKLCVLQ